MVSRLVSKIIPAIEQAEGAGVKVRRSIGSSELRNLSPFLLLDHFKASSTDSTGFPDHPHRGQETVTYTLSGAFDHEDFAGNAGRIYTGDLQFMTAGRGVVHSEMPVPNTTGEPNEGLQLWVDLPSKHKMTEARYQDLRDADIPRSHPSDKVTVKVISGESNGVVSPIKTFAGVWYLDIILKPGGLIKQNIPNGWSAFAYTLKGDPTISATKVRTFNTIVLSDGGDYVEFSNPEAAESEARIILIAGEPLKQKLFQYGPFVLDTQEGVYNAFRDFQSHSNGFERAKNWASRIGGLGGGNERG